MRPHEKPLHPALVALLDMLPDSGSYMPAYQIDAWLAAMRATLNLVYVGTANVGRAEMVAKLNTEGTKEKADGVQ